MKSSKPSNLVPNLRHNLSLKIRVDERDLDLLQKHRFYIDSNGDAFTKVYRGGRRKHKKVFLHTLVSAPTSNASLKFSPASNLAHNLALGILVDMQDLDLLLTHKFTITGGYAQTYIDLKPVMLHQLVASRMIGRPLSDDDSVRHIDPRGTECRRSNLRVKAGGKS